MKAKRILSIKILKIETIGVGRNLRDVGLSDDEIEYLLNNDIDRVEKQLDTYFPWWREKMEDCKKNVNFFCI